MRLIASLLRWYTRVCTGCVRGVCTGCVRVGKHIGRHGGIYHLQTGEGEAYTPLRDSREPL